MLGRGNLAAVADNVDDHARGPRAAMRFTTGSMALI